MRARQTAGGCSRNDGDSEGQVNRPHVVIVLHEDKIGRNQGEYGTEQCQPYRFFPPPEEAQHTDEDQLQADDEKCVVQDNRRRTENRVVAQIMKDKCDGGGQSTRGPPTRPLMASVQPILDKQHNQL